MNTLQNALQQAFPEEMERIVREERERECMQAKAERKRKFERAVARGRRLQQQSGQLVTAGKLLEALKVVRNDRYAFACWLAEQGRKSVREGFEELEKMEDFLALQVAKGNGQSAEAVYVC